MMTVDEMIRAMDVLEKCLRENWASHLKSAKQLKIACCNAEQQASICEREVMILSQSRLKLEELFSEYQKTLDMEGPKK